jgi:hypothetical protein
MKALTWVFLVAVVGVYGVTGWLTLKLAFTLFGWIK